MNDFPRAHYRANHHHSITSVARASSYSAEGAVSFVSNCECMSTEARDNG
jgi:hypothetical protein